MSMLETYSGRCCRRALYAGISNHLDRALGCGQAAVCRNMLTRALLDGLYDKLLRDLHVEIRTHLERASRRP